MWKSVYEIILISKKIRSYSKIKILRRKKMKKLLIMLMVVAMASFLFVGCFPVTPPGPDEPVDPDEPGLYLVGIAIDPKTMDLSVGESDTIDSVIATYEIRGYDVDIIDLEDCLFLTSDSKVATVSVAGKVTAVAKGTADILVKYEGKFATLEVTITSQGSMKIIADMPLFELTGDGGCTDIFTIEIMANDDVNKLVKSYFTLPEGFVAVDKDVNGVITPPGPPEYTLEWFHPSESIWVDMTVFATGLTGLNLVLGETDGDPLMDEVKYLKATFGSGMAGTYEITVESWEVDEDGEKDVKLCSKVIIATVIPAL